MPPPRKIFTKGITFHKVSGVDVCSGSGSAFCAGAAILPNVWYVHQRACMVVG